MEPVKIRNVVAGDLPYLYATGLRTWRGLDNSALPDDLWFAAHREVLNRLLGSSKTEVLIACSSDLPNEILGYIIAEPALDNSEGALWLTYVRKSLRRMGLCRQLMEAAGVSQKTPSAWAVRDVGLRNPMRSRQLRSTAVLSTGKP